ncbi:MAG: hypothetical protein R3B09_03190 [Nannocystaceae bacterium]
MRAASLVALVALVATAPACVRSSRDGAASLADAGASARAGRVSEALRGPLRGFLDLYDEAGFDGVEGLRRVRYEAGTMGRGGAESILWLDAWVLPGGRGLLLDSLWTSVDALGSDGSVPAFMVEATGSRSSAPSSSAPNQIQEVDFLAALRAELAEVERRPAEAIEEVEFEMRGRAGPGSVRWLARARWAEMLGDDALARRALDQVVRFAARECRARRCTTESVLRDGLQTKLLWQAVDGLAGWRSRAEVRALLVRALAIAPRGEHVDEARALLERTEATLASDRSGADAWPDAALPEAERIARLVHLLREQNGRQWSQPGACDPLRVDPSIRNPAAELIAIGRPAIPALIDHVVDETLTRSVGFHRDFYFSHQVLSVGEVALVILEGVAGRRFTGGEAAAGQQDDARMRAIQAEARAWWSSAQHRSAEEQLLVDLRAAPEGDRPGLVLRVLARAGLGPWDELVALFHGTRDPGVRARLIPVMNQGSGATDPPGLHVTVLGPVGDEPPEEQAKIVELLRAALGDVDPRVRLAAAEALQGRGRSEGLAVLIRDLEAIQDPAARGGVGFGAYFGALLDEGSPEAVAAVARALRRWGRPAIAALWPFHGELELSPAARRPLLDAIAGFLEVPDRIPYSGERVRDLAGRAYAWIAEIDAPGLDSERPSIERDRAILGLVNRRRQDERRAPLTWPHTEPLGAERPGRDVLRRRHRLHVDVGAVEAQRWLEALPAGAVSLPTLVARFVGFARAQTGVAWTLRVLRFPGDRGVVLTLEGARLERGSTQETSYACLGAPACETAGLSSGGPVERAFDDFIQGDARRAWAVAPTRTEEYVLTVAIPASPP